MAIPTTIIGNPDDGEDNVYGDMWSTFSGTAGRRAGWYRALFRIGTGAMDPESRACDLGPTSMRQSFYVYAMTGRR